MVWSGQDFFGLFESSESIEICTRGTDRLLYFSQFMHQVRRNATDAAIFWG